VGPKFFLARAPRCGSWIGADELEARLPMRSGVMGATRIFVKCGLSRTKEQVKQVVPKAARNVWERLDVLVNMPGLAPTLPGRTRPVRVGIAVWRSQLKSQFHLFRNTLFPYADLRHGRIINMSCPLAADANGVAPYAESKGRSPRSRATWRSTKARDSRQFHARAGCGRP